MSFEERTGGSAFPVMPPEDGTGYPFPECDMTLLEWYAGQALPKAIEFCRGDEARSQASPKAFEVRVAEQSFLIADAMLAEVRTRRKAAEVAEKLAKKDADDDVPF